MIFAHSTEQVKVVTHLTCIW